MLKTSIKNFFKLFKYHRVFAILSVLSLTISILSLFILFEKAIYDYNIKRSREYFFIKSYSPSETIRLYNDILNEKNIPNIVSISLINKNYTGILYTDKFNIDTFYGRSFTLDEVQSENNIAMLSTGYIENMKDSFDTVWEDGININDEHISLLGSYNDIMKYFPFEALVYDSPIPNEITLPAKTFLKLGLRPFIINCRFENSPNKEEIQILEKIANSSITVTEYNIPGLDNYCLHDLISTLFNYSALILLSMIAVSIITIYWFLSEYRRYKIYLIYGAKKRHILFFLFMNIFILNFISFIIAYSLLNILHIYFLNVILSYLPNIWYLYIFISFLAISFIMVIIKSLPIWLQYRKIAKLEVIE